jgi:NAD(P)-dependent dehydrogenase (short-subunit alcohol dehydrogenase family)
VINSGLGAVIAEKFASEGANVVINYVSSEDRAKETEAKINSQYAVKTAIVQGVCSLFFYAYERS